MRSLVPAQRRIDQRAAQRGATANALHHDKRDAFRQENAATTIEPHQMPAHDALPHMDGDARVARPATLMPLFPQETTGSAAPNGAGNPPKRNIVQAVTTVKETQAPPAAPIAVAQRKESSDAPANKTGLPDALKAGIENLSGMSLSDVKVHYNSSKPQQLQALAYSRGAEIHLASGQERHLPHEAWHVVQQKHGRVKPTLQIKGQLVNNDPALEREADEMGARALSHAHPSATVAATISPAPTPTSSGGDVAQLRTIPGKISSPTGAKVYKSIGIVNSDAIGGKRAAKGTSVWIDSEKSVEKYEHVTIDGGTLVDGSPIPVGGHGFVEGYINREKLEFAGTKAQQKQLDNVVIKPEVLEQVDAWLLAEARASHKEKLITEGGYDALSPFRKVEVFRRAGVVVNVHDANSFKKLKRGTFTDSIDWVLFSAIVRRINGNASAQKVLGGGDLKTGQTPFATSNTEYVGYVGLGGTAAAAGASALTAQTEYTTLNKVANIGTFHQTGAAQAMQGADIVGGALATVANITEIIRTLETIKSKSGGNILFKEGPYLLDQIAQIGVSAGRIVATAAGVKGNFSIAQVSYDQASAAAAGHSALFLVGAQVTGILSAVAGAAKMAKGIYDVLETTSILNDLAGLKQTLTSQDFKVALTQSQESLKLKRTVAGATAVQGAAMVAGGIMVAVLATNPIGWLILSAAALFGGAVAAYKYFKKKANQKKFVDRLLIQKIPGIAKKSDTELDEKVRKENLHKLGYTKVDAFYNDVIMGFATVVHAALSGNITDTITKEASALVSTWRMSTDPKKTTVQMIASKMHSG